MCTIHLKIYSRLVKRLRTKHNLASHVILPTICPSPRDHNQVLLRLGGDSASTELPILLTFLSQPIFAASIPSLGKHILRSNCHTKLTSDQLYFRVLSGILLSSLGNFVDQHIGKQRKIVYAKENT